MPAVRNRSRRVRSPVYLESGKPQTADAASVRSTSDSGVDVCLDEEMSSRATKRQPPKRRQQQEQPQSSGELENKKRRVSRNHSAQQSNSEEAATSRSTSKSSRRGAKTSEIAAADERVPETEPKSKKSSKAKNEANVRKTTPETPTAEAQEHEGDSSDAEAANNLDRQPTSLGPSYVLSTRGSEAEREGSPGAGSTSTARAGIGGAIVEDAALYDTGRPRRAARASRVSTVVKTVIPKGDSDEESDIESETDFSDDDDEDFVLPGEKSDYSDDDIPDDASDVLPEPISESHEQRAAELSNESRDEPPAPHTSSAKRRDRRTEKQREKRPGRQRERRPERRRDANPDICREKNRSRGPLTTLGRNKNIIKFLKDINQPRSSIGNVVIDLTEDTKRVKTEVPDGGRSLPKTQRKNERLPSVKAKREPIGDSDTKPNVSRAKNVPWKERSLLSSDESDAETGPSVKSMSVPGDRGKDVVDQKPGTSKSPEEKRCRLTFDDSDSEAGPGVTSMSVPGGVYAVVEKPGTSKSKGRPKEKRARLTFDESDPEAGPSVRSKSFSRGQDEDVAEKKSKTSKSKGAAKKKRSHSSSDESVPVLGPKKSGKKVKTASAGIQLKTFMKPRKAPKPISQNKSTPGSSRLEMTLLRLAKQMDDSDETSEDESQESSQATAEIETTAKPVETAKQEPENEADKKRLIMSMLKEHEDVDEMSDDSSDEEGAAAKASVPTITNEPGTSATTSTVGAETGGPDKKKTTQNDRPPVKGRKKADTREKDGRKSQEAAKKTAGKKKTSKKKGQTEIVPEEEDDDSSGSDDDNWEVVEERDPNYKRPENVTVVLQNEDFLPESKRLSMEQRMIRLINRKRKSSYLLCHRVHLMCLVAHQRILNSVANDDFVKASALSRLPPLIAVAEKRQKDFHIIKQILLFYKSAFELKDSEEVFNPKILKGNLIKLLVKKVTSCNIVYLFGLLVLLRAGGIRTRLCLSYHLLPQKAPLLRVKDGEIVELGSKTKASASDFGIGDFFIEVYMSDKKRWRPIDIDEFSVIEDPHELTPHLEQPVACLLGIDGSGCMVDLSPKYNADWLDKMKHLRRDAKFFDEVIARYAPAESEQADEQQEVNEKHEQQGLPKIISQYKNHPKYALSRHLLKFEAFYPKEPPVLGYVRNEPVHPRECVHTLRSKDTWHRLARQVKEGELPYSIVKARPKWNKQTESLMRDLPLEVYGEWQTEPYKPPVAENGIIPRNKFGNVELFHPDMLPIGTVHLKLPGLQRIAAELEIDCVPAVVGFDGVGRGCHPVIEGFVVCVENRELLEEAWNERQREDRHKRRERIRKRAIKNWRKLIKKVIWDLRLKRKYKSKLEQD